MVKLPNASFLCCSNSSGAYALRKKIPPHYVISGILVVLVFFAFVQMEAFGGKTGSYIITFCGFTVLSLIIILLFSGLNKPIISLDLKDGKFLAFNGRRYAVGSSSMFEVSCSSGKLDDIQYCNVTYCDGISGVKEVFLRVFEVYNDESFVEFKRFGEVAGVPIRVIDLDCAQDRKGVGSCC